MNVRVKFLGAAQTVTGSKYILEIDNFTLLVDCGLFQGLKKLRLKNWDTLPYDVSKIDAILLTHAHIDHSGYLPRIVKEGYNGPIYCTNATASLLELMLNDAAKLQEEEAEYARKKGYSKHDKPQPLFNTKDVAACLSLIQSIPYQSQLHVDDRIKATYFDAGHILGSAIIKVELFGEKQTKSIVFSGDLGRYDQPLLHNPANIAQADILFIESTYGDRVNEAGEVEQELLQLVKETIDKGCLLIPAFAVGRTQLLLYYFHKLYESGEMPFSKVYVDSPMAISATNIHKKHRSDHKLSIGPYENYSIFDNKNFHYYRSRDESSNLNEISKGAIIISASGMCTGGRILHHLYHRLQNKKDTLLFVGFQPEGTRGYKILHGDSTSRIFGIDVPVNCNIKVINGLSAHADMNELHQWVGNFTEPPKMTFVIHGEKDSSMTFANYLSNDLNWKNVFVPEYLESFELFKGI